VQNPKKVLIFSVTYYPKLVGGDVVAVKEITDRLSPKEYEFHLITIRFDKNLPKEEKIGNVSTYKKKINLYHDIISSIMFITNPINSIEFSFYNRRIE
jgi:hypothetical protein